MLSVIMSNVAMQNDVEPYTFEQKMDSVAKAKVAKI